ncbi:MAG: thiamine phosphate synthase [Lachnospiraceae bacterium]
MQADGVHVGGYGGHRMCRSKVGDQMIIGVSAHSVEEAVEAVKNGADCLGVSDVYNLDQGGCKRAAKGNAASHLWKPWMCRWWPWSSMGESNILELAGTGADGVALVSAIFGAADIEAQCRKLRALSEEMVSR